ncbi:MAG: hypothetical protein Q8M65_04115 [Rhodoglobus sp.]|nr:hypothetical protein [Rhodoglobus sp.]
MPSPTCPAWFDLQQKSSPAARRAQVCWKIAVISTTARNASVNAPLMTVVLRRAINVGLRGVAHGRISRRVVELGPRAAVRQEHEPSHEMSVAEVDHETTLHDDPSRQGP